MTRLFLQRLRMRNGLPKTIALLFSIGLLQLGHLLD